MTELHHARRLARSSYEGLRARRFSSVELTQHFLARIERLNPALNAFITVTAEQALAAARARRSGAGSRRSGAADRPAASCTRTSSAPTACSPPAARDAVELRRAVRRHGRRAPAQPASSCSARRTWTSSRWARRTRPAGTARCSNPWDLKRCRAALRAARPLRSLRALRPRRPAPTRAARSVSPRRSPA